MLRHYKSLPCRPVVYAMTCLWRIVILPMIPQDSPVLLRFCDGQPGRSFIRWFAKAPAEAQGGSCSPVTIIASIEQEDSGGHPGLGRARLSLARSGKFRRAANPPILDDSRPLEGDSGNAVWTTGGFGLSDPTGPRRRRRLRHGAKPCNSVHQGRRNLLHLAALYVANENMWLQVRRR